MDDDLGGYFGDTGPGGPDTPELTPPPVVADRYQLGPVLGTGSHGTVYRAHDDLLNRDVALKLLWPDADPARLRRETVALRSLRIVGVVRLLDDGLHGRWPFLVMELARGRPFRAAGRTAPWPELRHPAASLFEVLGRVHEAGVLHLDLKPANVCVRADDSVVLLDLGLAGGPALGGAAPDRCTGGTRRYMAPEQVSGRVDARSDLYAAGVMIHEALTGRLPGPGFDAVDVGAELPPRVGAIVRALVQPDPDARPASAWEVRDRLDVPARATGAAFVPAGVEALRPDQLEPIFAGPERILHLRSDPAKRLHRRTAGAADRVAAELDRWLRLGVAVPDDGRLRVDRAALDWLDSSSGSSGAGDSSGSGDAELASLAVDGQWTAVANRAERAARAHRERGRPDRARQAIEQGLFAARRDPDDTGAELRLLALWAEMAIDRRDPLELGLALYEVGRARRRTDALAAVESLLRASAHAEGREPRRAKAAVAALTPFADPGLELRRHAVRLRVAEQQSLAEEEAVLDHALAWARGQKAGRVRARVLGWVGRLRYRQGRFDDSALLHEQAVESAVLAIERLYSLLNGASSQMEAGRHATARAFAQGALELARSVRVPLDEGRAEWLLRAIAYRMGEAGQPDRELASAAEQLGVPYLTAVIALNEAAVAWRAGALDVARTLAQAAYTQFERARIPGGCPTARALELACQDGLAGPERRLGGPEFAPPAQGSIDALARGVLADPVADIDWQVLGVVSLLRGGEPWRADARRLASAAPDPERRRELLAPGEVLRR